jgi:hypothetical protein
MVKVSRSTNKVLESRAASSAPKSPAGTFWPGSGAIFAAVIVPVSVPATPGGQCGVPAGALEKKFVHRKTRKVRPALPSFCLPKVRAAVDNPVIRPE